MRTINVISVIALVSVMTSGASALAADWKLGGFVDGQYQGLSVPASAEGFIVNEGALFVNKEMDGSEVRIALPLTSRGQTGNSLAFATGKAEAWVGHKYGNGFRWKLGQWASLFGFESNFSTDVAFSRSSMTKSFVTPTTNTGLNAGYDLGKEIALDAYVSNPSSGGNGQLPAGSNMEYGARLGFAPEVFHLSVGYAMHKAGTETGSLLDFTVGANLGAITVDGQFDITKQYLGALVATESGTAMVLQVLWAHSDELTLGGRFEMLNKIPLLGTWNGVAAPGTADQKAMGFTVGPQYQFSKELKAKVDYTYTNMKSDTVGGDGAKSHAYTVAAVYSFK